ncbi:hypothetical protein [Ruicaihuangia caeni]|uniref:Uncharacterized protein n=1 Tax=Ruicaihuangia caeni TaxID=3042517 RepID=A0AAW6T4J0_9MICO|nr:hypothetical protein [Klugiella sp. YN-L-19]MDI2097996.1 hypothetical protein [Klugiella sp. YN-L-19]
MTVDDVLTEMTARHAAVVTALAKAEERPAILDQIDDPATLRACTLALLDMVDAVFAGKQNTAARARFTKALKVYQRQFVGL